MTDLFEEKYGPSYLAVEQILADVHQMDWGSAGRLVELAKGIDFPETFGPLNAASEYGIEEQVIRASEDCRREVWSVIWDGSTKVDAWVVSLSAARAGMGAALGHLIGLTHYYGMDEHLALTADWYAVFDHVPEGEGHG